MPASDSRLNEIAKIKNKILEIESQLKEEKKISAKLRANSEKKIQQLSLIDDAIAAEMESFRWKKENILFAKSSFEEESMKRMKSLKQSENQIRQDIAGFDILEFENEKLHNSLKEVATEQMKNSVAKTTERERRKQKNFDTRMQMEEILRKTIKNFDNNYQQEAISKMEQEALQANAENNKIHTEFEMREQKTENLIRQQQTSYDQLMRLRIERDVVAVSTEIQEKNIAALILQNEREKNGIADLSKAVVALREEILQLREASTAKAAAAKNLAALQHDLQRAVKQRKKLLNGCIRVCHRMLNEGLGIAEKVRVYQSSQIAQRIGQIGELAIGEDVSDSSAAGVSGLQDDHHVIDSDRDGPGQVDNSSKDSGCKLPDIPVRGGGAQLQQSLPPDLADWDPDSVWRTPVQRGGPLGSPAAAAGTSHDSYRRFPSVKSQPQQRSSSHAHDISAYYRTSKVNTIDT